MNTYSVHISEGPISQTKRFAVFVHKRQTGAIVAGKTQLPTRERAESVARDYRAQFGVAEAQS